MEKDDGVMKTGPRIEKRRTSPLVMITFLTLGVVFVAEVLLIFGVLQMKASTVRRYCPRAYEPFLRLVGEHPAYSPHFAAIVEGEKRKKQHRNPLENQTGLESGMIPVLAVPADKKESGEAEATAGSPESSTNATAGTISEELQSGESNTPPEVLQEAETPDSDKAEEEPPREPEPVG
jgi:hypothetical protein